MSDTGLERGLEQLGDGGGPPAAWQETVLARIEVPPAPAPRRRARWPLLVVGGSGLVAAASAVVLFVALRTPDGPAPAKPPPARESAAAADRLMREIDQLRALQEDAYVTLLQAKTEAERTQSERELAAKKTALEALRRKLDRIRPAPKKTNRSAIAVKCDPNDPLCGVN